MKSKRNGLMKSLIALAASFSILLSAGTTGALADTNPPINNSGYISQTQVLGYVHIKTCPGLITVNSASQISINKMDYDDPETPEEVDAAISEVKDTTEFLAKIYNPDNIYTEKPAVITSYTEMTEFNVEKTIYNVVIELVLYDEHQWDTGTVTKEATETEFGIRTFTCTCEGCEGTKTEAIPKLGQNNSGTITVPMPVYKGDIVYDGMIHQITEFYNLSGLPAGTSIVLHVDDETKYISFPDELDRLELRLPTGLSFDLELPQGYVFEDNAYPGYIMHCYVRLVEAANGSGNSDGEDGNENTGSENTNTENTGSGSTNTENTGSGNTNTENTGSGNTNNDSAQPAVIKASLSQASYVYDGKVKNPSVIVKDENGNLIPSSSYEVSIPDGRTNAGIYEYKISLKGAYSGTETLSLSILPRGTTLSGLKARKKGFIAAWKKQAKKMGKARIKGYQIRYSLNASMDEAKVQTVSGYNKTSLKVSRLKAKKKYYVQVRTYMTVKGEKIYSEWSKTKKIKTR